MNSEEKATRPQRVVVENINGRRYYRFTIPADEIERAGPAAGEPALRYSRQQGLVAELVEILERNPELGRPRDMLAWIEEHGRKGQLVSLGPDPDRRHFELNRILWRESRRPGGRIERVRRGLYRLR